MAIQFQNMRCAKPKSTALATAAEGLAEDERPDQGAADQGGDQDEGADHGQSIRPQPWARSARL